MLALASKCAVLVVDDHLDTADLLRSYFRRQGLEVEAVSDGMEALEFLEQQVPRVIVLDESMPRMGGLELMRQLQARPEYREIPVIFYSAAYDWRKQMEAEALGAKGWFIKGVSSLNQVAERVKEHCAGEHSKD
jgi:CheY-like chemotaxis protein